MTTDVDIRYFYLRYITSAKRDYREYKFHRDEAKKIIEELYKYIDENKDIINKAYDIDVTKYELEWGKEYNDKEGLYVKCIRCVNNISPDDVNKRHVLQVIKYCNALRNKHKYARLTELAYKRENFSIGDYRKYVRAFFNKVHKCVLEGNGYEFGYGLGIYMINRWKILGKPRRKLDYAATRLNKQKLLNEGYKLYDELEAAWYKAHNIPYDGVDYRIFKSDDFVYEIKFYNTTLCSRANLEYKQIEYIHPTLKGITHKEIYDKCIKSVEDIYTLKVNLRVKLNLLLIHDPNKYLNFVRNVEQDKYKFRANYRKDR